MSASFPLGFSTTPPKLVGWYWKSVIHSCGTCWGPPVPTCVIATPRDGATILIEQRQGATFLDADYPPIEDCSGVAWGPALVPPT